MTVVFPWFLLSASSVLIYLWLARRSEKTDDQLFSAGFLLPESARSQGTMRARVRMAETWLACLLLTLLTLLGAQPDLFGGERLLITDGPVSSEDEGTAGAVIRAGAMPTVVSDRSKISTVDVPPNWRAASVHGRDLFPDYIQVFKSADRLPQKVIGAGIRRYGKQWGLAIQTVKGTQVSVDVDGRPLSMAATQDGFELVGLPRGRLITIKAKGGRPTFLCGRGSRALRLQRGQMPQSLERALALHPEIELVSENGDFVEGIPNASGEPSPFGIRKVHWHIEDPKIEQSLVLRFPGALNPPAAQVNRWSKLSGKGEVLLFGGEQPMVSFEQLSDIGILRFAFRPEDTDLLQTSGWPVLAMTIADRLHKSAYACITQNAGHVLRLLSERAIDLKHPDGRVRTFSSHNGMVLISGLDSEGLYSIFDGERRADLIVKPALKTSVDEPENPSEMKLAVEPPLQLDLWLWGACLATLIILCVVGQRRSWYLASFMMLLIAPFASHGLGGGPRPLSLLLDVSPSMKRVELNTDSAAMRALNAVSLYRADFADGIVQLGSPKDPKRVSKDAVAFENMMQAIYRTPMVDHELVLITDGRFRAKESTWHRPVIVYLAETSGRDVGFVEAEAVEMDDGLYVHTLIESDGPAQGDFIVRDRKLSFAFNEAGRQSLSVRLGKRDDSVETLSLRVDGDNQPDNDRLSVRVRRPLRKSALMLGDCPSSMRGYLASQFRIVDFETEPNFSDIRLAALCDTPTENIPKEILRGLPGWLERGGTLYLGGRRKAFGLGGWQGTELEQLSPLRLDPQPQGRGRIHLAVVMDTSGSMSSAAGGIGMEGLRQNVPRWLSGLNASDEVSIASFDASVNVLVNRTSLANLRRDGMPMPKESGGGTRFQPIVDWVLSSLDPNHRRYILMVSDGQFADRDALNQSTGQLSGAGVKLLTVALGEDADRLKLCELARSTDGHCFDGRSEAVPRFVSGTILNEAGVLDVAGGGVDATEAWSLRVGGSLPPMARKVRAGLKTSARLLARQAETPVLAEGAWGLGRVIALATDEWSLSTDQWRDLLSPALNQRDVDLRLRLTPSQVLIRGRPGMPKPSDPPIFRIGEQQVVGPDWRLIRPGEFASELPKEVTGDFSVRVRADGRLHQYALDARPTNEWMAKDEGQAVLTAMAEHSGGLLVSTQADLANALEKRLPEVGLPAYYLILLGAIGLILLSVSRRDPFRAS